MTDQLLDALKAKARFWYDLGDEESWADAKEAILDAAWGWAETDSLLEAKARIKQEATK